MFVNYFGHLIALIRSENFPLEHHLQIQEFDSKEGKNLKNIALFMLGPFVACCLHVHLQLMSSTIGKVAVGGFSTANYHDGVNY